VEYFHVKVFIERTSVFVFVSNLFFDMSSFSSDSRHFLNNMSDSLDEHQREEKWNEFRSFIEVCKETRREPSLIIFQDKISGIVDADAPLDDMSVYTGQISLILFVLI
jgi:hypothetical protein